ncbi:GNAT family N-acetyltransferase [Nocardioides sp. CPCC 205120]|uniref:GNAT family N-acetyltransferase n=1 Tax=Nocardioides sp. CPCC 205120 TaxID=3406462 RepID=UPI003B500EE8
MSSTGSGTAGAAAPPYRPDPGPPALPLRTERLLLRPHRDDDVAALGYYGDPDVTRYLLQHPLGEAELAAMVGRRAACLHPRAPGETLPLVVEHDGVVVGDVVLKVVDTWRGVGEVGWVLDPRHAGRGYATEAAAALVDLAFGHYGMHRVEARLDARNAASARVCARLDMRLEAHLRRDWWMRGEWTDTQVHAVLVEEWRAGTRTRTGERVWNGDGPEH